MGRRVREGGGGRDPMMMTAREKWVAADRREKMMRRGKNGWNDAAKEGQQRWVRVHLTEKGSGTGEITDGERERQRQKAQKSGAS